MEEFGAEGWAWRLPVRCEIGLGWLRALGLPGIVELPRGRSIATGMLSLQLH